MNIQLVKPPVLVMSPLTAPGKFASVQVDERMSVESTDVSQENLRFLLDIDDANASYNQIIEDPFNYDSLSLVQPEKRKKGKIREKKSTKQAEIKRETVLNPEIILKICSDIMTTSDEENEEEKSQVGGVKRTGLISKFLENKLELDQEDDLVAQTSELRISSPLGPKKSKRKNNKPAKKSESKNTDERVHVKLSDNRTSDSGKSLNDRAIFNDKKLERGKKKKESKTVGDDRSNFAGGKSNSSPVEDLHNDGDSSTLNKNRKERAARKKTPRRFKKPMDAAGELPGAPKGSKKRTPPVKKLQEVVPEY